MTKCIFCGKEIPKDDYPIPVAEIRFQPPNPSGLGVNSLCGHFSCSSCYRDILSNAATAAEAAGKDKLFRGAHNGDAMPSYDANSGGF
jgi:hypothetical protein